ERFRILRERGGRAAMQVTRNLIEQQDQREPSPRIVAPMVELARRCALGERGEPGGDLGVRFFVRIEPAVEAPLEVVLRPRRGFEPETPQLLDVLVHRLFRLLPYVQFRGTPSPAGTRACRASAAGRGASQTAAGS